MKPLQALHALFACAALPLCAAGLDDLTYTTTGGEVTITECDEDATGVLVIPDTIGGNPVTSIGGNAFSFCSSLTNITTPESVTSIGNEAFYECSGLTSVTIGDGVTSIGNSAFFCCRSLTSITIPDGVTSLGNAAFYGCSSLTSITIPDGVPNIGEYAFSGCSSLTSITIPDGVTSIGDRAFQSCSSLTSITVPDSVTSIGDFTFRGCNSLTSITIGDSVTSIGNRAFYDCTILTSITIPDSVTSIGSGAFDRCTSLTSITFMGAAPTVGTDAFAGVADGAIALVTIEALSSFGGFSTDWNSLIVSMSDSYLNDLSAQVAELSLRPTQVAYNAAVATARTDGQGDVTSDPASYGLVTQANYDDVIVERDSRFTEDQIHAMSADYTMGLNEAGNVQIKISFIESADLHTFTQFTVDPDSLSVVDGKICMEFTPSDDAAFFFRFRIE